MRAATTRLKVAVRTAAIVSGSTDPRKLKVIRASYSRCASARGACLPSGSAHARRELERGLAAAEHPHRSRRLRHHDRDRLGVAGDPGRCHVPRAEPEWDVQLLLLVEVQVA